MKTTREFDSQVEKNISRFMDEYFYKNFPYERVQDKKRQLQGIDVCLNGINIDEKVKFKGGFLNKILNYPSFEISFRNRKFEIQDGWFVKKDLKTDYYAFIAVFGEKIKDDKDLLEYENIDYLDVLLIKKQDVLDYVGDLDVIIKNAEELRKNFQHYCDFGNKFRFKMGKFYLTLSRQFFEQPVNLVLKRSVIEKFQHSKHYIIRKNGFEKV